MFKSIGEVILELIFPRFCCGCSKMHTYLCAECFNKIDLRSIPTVATDTDSSLKQLLAVCHYDGVIQQLIHTYKYDCIKDIGETLAEFTFYTTQLPTVDIITEVPLHKDRMRERGFNQSEIIAQGLARFTQITHATTLVRTIYTTQQAHIHDRSERQKNMRNCFTVPPESREIIRDKKILIIDDVTTTGATLNECARTLRAAGALAVYGLALAHGSY